eukprot:TRINITY_DN1451_c2_g1_i1.p2 TRINITY_DN1451_c2_g1~~TRINITY_DN1451_c2_g1_i1.p2  ORF type:complete len:250 (-),score=-22.02 TRINITY_DN1451_c2_g1_i1:300-965(-)
MQYIVKFIYVIIKNIIFSMEIQIQYTTYINYIKFLFEFKYIQQYILLSSFIYIIIKNIQCYTIVIFINFIQQKNCHCNYNTSRCIIIYKIIKTAQIEQLLFYKQQLFNIKPFFRKYFYKLLLAVKLLTFHKTHNKILFQNQLQQISYIEQQQHLPLLMLQLLQLQFQLIIIQILYSFQELRQKYKLSQQSFQIVYIFSYSLCHLQFFFFYQKRDLQNYELM